MKKILLMFCVISINLAFSQTPNNKEEFYKVIGKRVFINKDAIAYTFTTFTKTNGNTTQKTNSPSVDSPFQIFIKTDEKSSTIRINNKNTREDIFLEFNKIYKYKYDEKNQGYQFVGDNKYEATYIIPNNSKDNQSLIIDMNNGTSYFFTISKFNDI